MNLAWHAATLSTGVGQGGGAMKLLFEGRSPSVSTVDLTCTESSRLVFVDILNHVRDGHCFKKCASPDSRKQIKFFQLEEATLLTQQL